ncbi:hypothetical protein L195_g053619, partial [Trifolium pratense]
GTNAVTAVLREKFKHPWTTWGVMKKDKDGLYFRRFWQMFRTKCTWREQHTSAILASFHDRGSHNLGDMLGRARRNKKCPKWIGENVWKILEDEWKKPEYQAICAQAKTNRDSENGGCIHRGGCITIGQHKERMVN